MCSLGFSLIVTLAPCPCVLQWCWYQCHLCSHMINHAGKRDLLKKNWPLSTSPEQVSVLWCYAVLHLTDSTCLSFLSTFTLMLVHRVFSSLCVEESHVIKCNIRKGLLLVYSVGLPKSDNKVPSILEGMNPLLSNKYRR